MIRRASFLFSLWALLMAQPALAGDPAALCDQAAIVAAERRGVPLPILLAVTRAETGRTRGGVTSPWPWTINEAGPGSWFGSRAEAVDHVETAVAGGAQNIDIGCFQLNHRWHGAAFASVEAMFDPQANADYAAQFLAQLYSQTGDWRLAAGAFHSRTPDLAERYLARLDTFLDDAPTDGRGTVVHVVRVNGFPLLVSGQAGAIGSLVPTVIAGRPLLGP